VAKANKLDLEIVDTDPTKGPLDPEYLKINKLGKIPSFVGADGYELTESIAIAIYSMSSTFRHIHQPSTYMMRNTIIYSYPCLKTIVENYSHSEPSLFHHDILLLKP